jgi:predicted membrane protein (TIGR00267 family)
MIRKFVENCRSRLKFYRQVTDLESVSRRYFVIGFFDGILTVLGMITGAHLSGEVSSRLIISAGFATAFALGISSAWGAFEAERVEQKIMKKEKEKALLVNDRSCAIDEAHKFATYISSTIHGIAPIVAAVIPLMPYILLPVDEALIIALASGLASLFIVGAMMGRIAGFNFVISGLRMFLAGIVTMFVVAILSPTHFM